ncbi:estrogen receptor beta-like isoform X1 [Arapaima gigas]
MAAFSDRDLLMQPFQEGDTPKPLSPVYSSAMPGSIFIPSPCMDNSQDNPAQQCAYPVLIDSDFMNPLVDWNPYSKFSSMVPRKTPHSSPLAEPEPQSLVSTEKRQQRRRKTLNDRRRAKSLRFFPGDKTGICFCAVCQDYASGYHYGVWSCEGCKAFFKRSIQGPTDYICPANNQCTIDKNRRKSCQACRLRKCYEVGMVKSGIQRERCPSQEMHHKRTSQGLSPMGEHRSLPQEKSYLSLPLEEPQLLLFSPKQLISRILEAEPPDIYLMSDLKKPFTEVSMMRSLIHLADKELVYMISWAKKVPGFTELSLSDQVHLLDCCWLEVLMLGLMWRSVDHPGKLIFSPDLILSRDEGSCIEGILEIFDMLLAATSRFRELKLQKEEYVCLKALILLNSSMHLCTPNSGYGQQSRTKLQQLLNAVTDALVWVIAKPGLSSQQQSARLAHLIMLLSHIRHVSNKGMDHLHCMKMKKVVPFYDLLLEMLDAHIMQSSRILCPSPSPQS